MLTKNKKSPKRDDELWKGILEDVFDDFLRNRLFPPEEGAVGVRYVDKLVKVYLNNGAAKFILVHIEVQGQKGLEDLCLRMFRYFYRAKDKHNVQITAFAVLIDDVKNYHPKIYQEDYLGTRLSYEFNTYKLLEQDEMPMMRT